MPPALLASGAFVLKRLDRGYEQAMGQLTPLRETLLR